MSVRWRIVKGPAVAALVTALATAGCSSGNDGGSADRGVGPNEPSESGVLAEPLAPAGSPTFCTELTEQDALIGLASALVGDPRRITHAVLAAADELDSLSPPDSVDEELIAATAESLRTWATDPDDDGARTSMSNALGALGQEVQDLCAFPVG